MNAIWPLEIGACVADPRLPICQICVTGRELFAVDFGHFYDRARAAVESATVFMGYVAREAFSRSWCLMSEGTVKKITDKGFGFIDTGRGADLFFHSSNVEGGGFDQLYEGQKVTFNEGRGPKGARAENVRPV